MFLLLEAEERTGIRLTESYAMMPPLKLSVSGFYLNHPSARYFSVGKLGEDQVVDYAGRKNLSKAQAERWLRPNLGYEPQPLNQ